ncbi:MAG: winged helix-turn-helix transcriptional regulator [Candidatus Woesearchaeota archaeon]
MAKIDKKDQKILEILENNSRIPITRLAKKTHSSPQATHYRVNKLISEKIILDFPTVIDYAYFGLTEVKVYFKILYTSSKIVNQILSYFKDHEFVSEVIECGGNWDIVITYLVENLSQFNKIFHGDIEKFQKHLDPDLILFSIVHHFLPKNVVIGGDRKPIKFKKKTKKLLYLFALNNRITIVDLVKQLKMDSKTVIKRMNNLKKENIIRIFTVNIDKSLLNKTIYKILIRYSNISTKKEKEFFNFIKRQKGIKLFTKLIGKFNVELEIETEKNIELRKLIFEIREKFSSIIQDINEIPIYHLHKRSYLPKKILKD